MASAADHIKDIEDSTIPDLKQRLEVLRSGRTKIGISRNGGAFVDATEEMIKWTERLLVEYEAALAALKKDVV